MSQGANVGSVEALTDLRTALTQYAEEAGSALAGAARQVAATKAWLEERLAYWQSVARRSETEVARLVAELRHCYDTEDAYCGDIEQALSVARARLQAAQEEVATVRRWAMAIAQAAQAYDREARALATLLTGDLPRAASALSAQIAALQQYAALSAPSTGGYGTGVDHFGRSRQGASGSSGAADAVTDNLTEAIDTAMDILTSGEPPDPHDSTGGQNDICPVSIEDIDLSDSRVRGPDDFSKVSYEEMVEGFRKLEEVVIPGVAQGWTSDDFGRLDTQRGLDRAHGHQRIYDAFYGTDAIRLEQGANGRCTVVNGYHRLYVAKQLGLTSVPARVAGGP